MNVTVQDMMEARDRRAEKQRSLLDRYGKTLLCFTMNIPGPEKDNPLIRQGFLLGKRRLRRGFLRLGITPLHEEEDLSFTGCEACYVLPLSPLEIKRMTADIEEADALGRLFDLDVLRPDGCKVDRPEVGLPPRSCLICGGDARVCARSRSHMLEELRAKTDQILTEALAAEKAETIAGLACQALMAEVLTTPKPGLVDRMNSGSHRDMDTFTFSASTAALRPYFAACARIGLETAADSPDVTFEKIRLQGRIAEGAMLEATHGINTHRGAVFSIGLLCAAAGRLGRPAWQMDALLDSCGEMTRDLTARDFDGLNEAAARSFGQKLYLAHGVTGVRGEAEHGFPLVRKAGYPKLRAGLAAGKTLNDAGCAALIAIMAQNIDTSVIHRSSMEKQQELLHRCAGLLESEPWPSAESLQALDRELIRENISPGGSADLLAMCYMLFFLEEEAQ